MSHLPVPRKRASGLTTTWVLAMAVLLVGVLAGCGGSDKSTASPAPTSGNATDRAFVRQMIPHHEMAVSMAGTALKEDGHAQIRTLARSIIAAQNAEIAQMRPIAERLDVTPAVMPMNGSMSSDTSMTTDDRTLGLSMSQSGMTMNMTTLPAARPFDRAFIDMMIPHHQGAVRMSDAELARGTNPQLRQIARTIIAGQSQEIRQMNAWRVTWYGSASPAGGVPR